MGPAGLPSHWSTCIYQPQRAVVKPHSGQRQTACIRYISALPQRSQIILSSAGVILSGGAGRTGGGGASGMAGIISGHLGIWSSGHLVIWSSGHLVICMVTGLFGALLAIVNKD